MSAAERRKALEQDANRAWLRAKIIEAAASMSDTDDANERRCRFVGHMIGAASFPHLEDARLMEVFFPGPEV
jgi:hypothetical protein